MNKVCIIGDIHFKAELSYSSSVSDGRRSEWEAVKRTIHKTAKECSAVVLMGDNLNSRNNPSAVLKEFIEFLKEFGDKPIHILVGNHERQGLTTALDFLDKVKYPGWHVYTDITGGVDIGDKIATFVPSVTPAILGVETKEEAADIISNLPKADIAFMHHAINGTSGTEFFNEIIVDKDKLKFGMTFGGHVHKAERLSDKVIITGSIMTAEIGEHKKSVWVWNGDDNSVEEVPLPVRGIHKIDWDENFEKNLEAIPQKSIVKCVIEDKKASITLIKDSLKGFDSALIIEQYPNERSKVDYGEKGLDLSVESLLKIYAKNKEVSYKDLSEGFMLIK